MWCDRNVPALGQREAPPINLTEPPIDEGGETVLFHQGGREGQGTGSTPEASTAVNANAITMAVDAVESKLATLQESGGAALTALAQLEESKDAEL